MRPLLIYAGIRLDKCIAEAQPATNPLGHERIKQALEKVWDGSDVSAVALAQVIEAVGHFLIDKGMTKSHKR